MNDTCSNSKQTALRLLILSVLLGQSAVAQIATHRIEAAAGVGGSIDPSGAVSANSGGDITFTITPDEDHVISNIVIDDISVGAASRYTIFHVKQDSVLRVSFLPKANVTAETIYVDNSLASDCTSGQYSIANRDSSGSDGNAYTSIVEAANVAGPGDTVCIRAGSYNSGSGPLENDVLWPKHSGTAQKPITFKPYNDEPVIIGRGAAGWPSDNWLSIARGVITLRNVSHIRIRELTFDGVAGWMFARDCSHVTIEDCTFENATWGAKGGARVIECDHFVFKDNAFRNSTFDSLVFVMSRHNLLQGNTFDTARHALLALRSASYTVVRNNSFRNPMQKLVEVYDQKLDTRDSFNPSYIAVPAYDQTRHNLFEGNLFGFHPYFKNMGAQPSAMQYSGQSGIIRRNVFCNPVPDTPAPAPASAGAGGIGIYLRWGGSWTGWNGNRIVGEAHEAGFVTQNRIYHNTFWGYDNGQVQLPIDKAMDRVANPPPMKNVSDFRKHLFDKRFAFDDNIFKNNIFSGGRIVPHLNWEWLDRLAGRPVLVLARGRLRVTHFRFNNFFGSGRNSGQLIYDQARGPYILPAPPAYFDSTYATFSDNTQEDPQFVDADGGDFHLRPNSPMIDAGGFLTTVAGAGGSGSQMAVEDASYFYAGNDIPGETGDLVRLEGHDSAVRVVEVDYERNILGLSESITWRKGQGVSLVYSGSRPDMGAFEFARGR